VERERLDNLLAEIRALHAQTLAELEDMTEDEFARPTDMGRWDDVRRVLLRFGDHMREHGTQVMGARAAIGRELTMPQRILAEAEVAWGRLLGATTGLNDRDLTSQPPSGGWSVQETLEHVKDAEKAYLDAIGAARDRQAAD
jgi:hypothetical protein